MNITEILLNEKYRLDMCCELASKKYRDALRPALIQKPQLNHLSGEEVMVSYAELDLLTPEQRIVLDASSRFLDENISRRKVFSDFTKSFVPQEITNSYTNIDLTPISTPISANNVELDENGQFTKYSIKVGPINVPSKKEMTIEEYTNLYTSSLANLLPVFI